MPSSTDSPSTGGTAVGLPGIPFIDLGAHHRPLRLEIDAAIRRVFESGNFVLGPEVLAFERDFAAYVGTAECVGVSSGTAALHLALMAIGLQEGDEVILPANTFFATAEAVIWAGGLPVLVDVREDDATIDPARIEPAVTPRTRGIVPVDLYGQPARLPEIEAIAERHGLFVLEDACQAHGAAIGVRRAGSFGRAAAFSFYPGKNLGACGEAGAVVTNDGALAAHVRVLRDHGQTFKYRHTSIGHNFRLEALQGAILGVKLKHLDRWNTVRRSLVERYRLLLRDADVELFETRPGVTHAHHLFVVRSRRRDGLRAHLESRGVATLVHYPIPLHCQAALAHLGHGKGAFPVSERLAGEIVSLPLFPEMRMEQVEEVARAVHEYAGRATGDS